MTVSQRIRLVSDLAPSPLTAPRTRLQGAVAGSEGSADQEDYPPLPCRSGPYRAGSGRAPAFGDPRLPASEDRSKHTGEQSIRAQQCSAGHEDCCLRASYQVTSWYMKDA